MPSYPPLSKPSRRQLGAQFWPRVVIISVAFLMAGAKPRAAQSVLLVYHAPPAVAVYNSVKVLKSQRGSYFQVCGFSHGYCGLQELTNGRHVIIFSIWNPVPAIHHKAVRPGDWVRVLYAAPGGHPGRFGGEGTGEHILFPYRWHVGRAYHIAIRSRRIGQRTAYGLWIYRSRKKRWMHLATFSTLAGKPLGIISGEGSGYYSFIEDFRRNTASAKEVRQAIFGPMWISRGHNKWVELTRAAFESSHAPWEARGHIAGVVMGSRIRLTTGGATRENTAVGKMLKLKRLSRRVPSCLKRLPPW